MSPVVPGRYSGLTVIVTGAGQGIGAATARRVASEGATVAIVDRHAPGVGRTNDELTQLGATAIPIVADLSTHDAAVELMKDVVAEAGKIDVLVNNIGGATQFKPFWEWSPQEAIAEIKLSLFPTIWCCMAVLPYMREQGSGSIVNVGAESVRFGLWDRAFYNTAKGGVDALSASIAREAGAFGIRCNVVAPGGTASEATRLVQRGGRAPTPEEAEHQADLKRRQMEITPLGRQATVDEQASVIAFVASADAGFMTGQRLSVNGGATML